MTGIGVTNPNKKRDSAATTCSRFHVLRLIIFLAVPCDFISKIVALGLLSEQEPIVLLNTRIILDLNINSNYISDSVTLLISENDIDNALFLELGIMYGIVALFGFRLLRIQSSPLTKFSFYLLSFLATISTSFYAEKLFSGITISCWAIWIFHGAGVLLLGFSILNCINNRLLFFSFSFFVAGNLANWLNLLYFPAGIIDWISLGHIGAIRGTTNIADIIIEFGKHSLLLSFLGILLAITSAKTFPRNKGCLFIYRKFILSQFYY